MCSRGHELHSTCSILFYSSVPSLFMPNVVPCAEFNIVRCPALQLHVNHIFKWNCFSCAFFSSVNQIVAQGCSFFARTTHGPPPLPLTFLKDTLSSSFVPSLIVRLFIMYKVFKTRQDMQFDTHSHITGSLLLLLYRNLCIAVSFLSCQVVICLVDSISNSVLVFIFFVEPDRIQIYWD